VAANDSYTVQVQTTLTVAAPGLLANDTDPDSPQLTASVVTPPASGSLMVEPDGGFSYAPRPGFAGTDTFTYRASDGANQSSVATVTIVVTPTACAPRPRVQAAPAVGGGKLRSVHVEPTPLNTQQPNPLKELRFGALQNARVTLNGQPVASGQVVTPPAGASALDLTVERATQWPTFVGGGTGAGF
jgi:hypothetical protein